MPSSSVVITNLIGGLGNQMFQYAAGRALADRHNAKLLLDLSGFENYSLRRYELETLNIRAEIASQSDIEFFRSSVPFRWEMGKVLNNFSKILLSKKKAQVFNESTFSFMPELQKQPLPLYMSGYWQSERYFNNSSDIIRRDFELKEPLDVENKKILNKIQQTVSISLHVRRGDYVTNSTTAKFHGTCSLDYYYSAIRFVASRVQHPHFFIFSDDLDWVSKNLNLSHPSTLVDINGPSSGAADIALMKQCQHNIIANSSFSWWGAWLNPSPHKIVVAPQRWFNQSTHDTSDLLPAKWFKL
ncbi:flagellar biosynthetic protein FliQ [Novimethylophilus kurashikiensis]|uniref:Flagellar biosynthetic protein FliQ n=1 Tax=Novimethylophilus kurashikiensis TaxID=1825523 RepID=A0A2R5F4G4_9PROT|nr:alpha-1,2-fucosyltransferase [Novimethylophilus kurashikiensis]GBG13297.1 flagellar biosynthetic protein FliQ [Novimethylophilus kurashikiensis]